MDYDLISIHKHLIKNLYIVKHQLIKEIINTLEKEYEFKIRN